MKKLRLYLDDMRPKPADFDLLVRTVEETIELIKKGNVEFISMDSDLGTGYTEGYRLANWIEENYITGKIDFVDFYPHTSNPSNRPKIMSARENIYKHKEKIESHAK